MAGDLSEKGLLAFLIPKGRGGVAIMANMNPLIKEHAEQYVEAKLLVRKLENDDNDAPQVYWVPLSAFQPLEPTGLEELTEELAIIKDDDEDEDDLSQGLAGVLKGAGIL